MEHIRKLAFAYATLLVLLGLTVGSSLLDLHGANTAVNLLIAAMKAAVVAVVFMKLTGEETLPPLVAVAVALWLAILFGLTLIG
ncbi:Caa(3)-type oxidase, subunit IV [Mesorhizobium plurifarium]|uniref:Caa(3)-type oxidase, subunit IV n=1 Tax=Mesorhizobium plurifarium TaxID=69974 RepID=A0A090GT45_MESPL|nr:Caa(3)-type oxidase, subunit IV [Mesorhizobium plurifarium]